jgi:hypothetical protein
MVSLTLKSSKCTLVFHIRCLVKVKIKLIIQSSGLELTKRTKCRRHVSPFELNHMIQGVGNEK